MKTKKNKVKLLTKILSHSEKETESAGAILATALNKGDFVALYGDLGVGKTAFVRGIASIVAPDAEVCSPTYAICNEYEGKSCALCHFDMYRITGEDDLYACGFYDYNNCIFVVEWSENIPYALPDSYYKVSITKVEGSDENLRTLMVEQILKS